MISRLSGRGAGGRSGASAPPVPAVPAVASGQTRLFMDASGALPTAASPGAWTSVIDNAGMIAVGTVGGPTVLATAGDQSTRFRQVWAQEMPTAAQVSAGYAVRSCRWDFTAGSFDNGNSTETEIWVRPSATTMTKHNTVGLVTINDGFSAPSPGNVYYALGLISGNSGTTYNIRWERVGEADYDSAATLPTGEWCRIVIQNKWNTTGASSSQRVWYQTYIGGVAGTITEIYFDNTTGFPTPGGGGPVVWVNPYVYGSNQPGFSGQFVPPYTYSCTAFSDGNTGIADFLSPSATGNRYSGTLQQAFDKVNNCTMMGTARNFQLASTGARRDDASFADNDARVQFCRDYYAGLIRMNPLGDTFTVSAGMHYVSAPVLRSSPIGISLLATGVTAIVGENQSAMNWNAYDLTGTADVYSSANALTGTLGTVVPQNGKGVGPIFAADLTEATPRLKALPWYCWVNPADSVAYLSVPKGTTPPACDFTSGNVLPKWTGGLIVGMTAWADQVNWTQTGVNNRLGNQSAPSALFESGTLPTVTVYDACTALGMNKHHFTHDDGMHQGVTVASNCKTGMGAPINAVDVWRGVGTGDWNPIVDYVSDSGAGTTFVSGWLAFTQASVGYMLTPGSTTGTDWTYASGLVPYETHSDHDAQMYCTLVFGGSPWASGTPWTMFAGSDPNTGQPGFPAGHVTFIAEP